MKLKTIVTAALLLAAPTFAQAVTELLQKGIYAQDTSGNFDEAIMIYRQIVNSASGQRDIAAQAQYRLAETFIRKGDLANAATEFQKLARDYPDQQALISRLAPKMPPQRVDKRTEKETQESNGIATIETMKFLADQVDIAKRDLELEENKLQADPTPEARLQRQANMAVMKAKLAELTANLRRAQEATAFELRKADTQSKSRF